MKGGLLLDVVVREGTTILKLLPSKNEPLLVRRNAFFVLNLLFYILYRIGAFNFEGNGLPCERLYKDLHV